MTVEQMRGWLEYRYPGSAWAIKVASMADAQVIAVYKQLIGSGNIVRPQYKELPAIITYACPDCTYTFTSNDSEVRECVHCGGKNIFATRRQEKKKYVRIMKGTQK